MLHVADQKAHRLTATAGGTARVCVGGCVGGLVGGSVGGSVARGCVGRVGGCCHSSADPDPNVKNGALLLDRLVKVMEDPQYIHN